MKMPVRSRLAIQLSVLMAGLIAVAAPGFAYKLSTRSTPEERRLSGITSSYWTDMERALARLTVSGFTEPVHEEITNRMYGCEGDAEICAGDRALTAPAAVLAGVRWNDDPPFRMNTSQARGTKCKTTETIRFETQPSCWVSLFQSADRGAAQGKKFGPGDAMLYRTHFGDLQFLHAMATRDGELAAETKQRMMGWFEFSWRAGLGEYSLDSRLKEIDIPSVREAFGKTEWRLLDLYTQGSGGGLRRSVDDVAFGSLLHTVQDSFAAGHADREEASGSGRCAAGSVSVVAPGEISNFHSYNHQDHALHAQADSRAAFMREFQHAGHVVQVGRGLVEARENRLSWDTMEPMFDCLFKLSDPATTAGPGDFTAGL